MRRIICWLKAIPFFMKTWEWIPHVYQEKYEKAIIVSTENSFRVATGYDHKPGETVHKNACLIRQKCKHCGCEKLGWYENWDEKLKLEV